MSSERYSYLAGPYTSKSTAVMDMRAAVLTKIAAKLMMAGEIIFSPITHGHAMAVDHDLPREISYWKKVVEATLPYAKELIVVMMDGWAISEGVAFEINLARTLGIPVRFVDPDDYL